MSAVSRATRSVTHTHEHLVSTIAELGEVPVIELVDGGRVVAVLIAPDLFEALLDAADDADDYRALAEHAADPDPDMVPLG
ncbi:hypothetical protein [Rhodococcus sp. ARC_M6]|uniref:hypothetical protein n=1 Tax=Rhodococcus sp. ARC_M6 TaxID=2928852 RepID=UPI001FB2458E|nr:hypothetical protein [Rhodococcus sp. ARC_M6]MCJ0907071.1 hypothetical protein [Rhodococcus sp. ARC_M6]